MNADGIIVIVVAVKEHAATACGRRVVMNVSVTDIGINIVFNASQIKAGAVCCGVFGKLNAANLHNAACFGKKAPPIDFAVFFIAFIF